MAKRIIYPVILPVPIEKQGLKGREKVAYLSQYARYALDISAQKKAISVRPEYLLKDEKGTPLPFHGYYWSLTHKSEYVGGVIGDSPMGMDIEKIYPCAPGLFQKLAHDDEWSLTQDPDPFVNFFRYWTAKEAVLKATSIGIRDLLKCKITHIQDTRHLIITYQDKEWRIEHLYFDTHIASVVKDHFQIEWIQGVMRDDF